MRTATITINTKALTHNLQQVRHRVSTANNKTKILAMVKANAYGHGVANCINALQDADAFGVASFEEAEEIRSLGCSKPLVLIEGVFSEQQWLKTLQRQYQCVIHQHSQVNWALTHIAANESPSRTLWLKVNTGMNRLGFQPEAIVDIAQLLVKAGYHLILTSHFANADIADNPLNTKQIHCFSQLLQQLRQDVDPSINASLCNSAGIINFPDYHFDWVRPGIMLYGSTPLQDTSAVQLDIQPVMKFAASLIAVHPIEAGCMIGYGSRYVSTRPMLKGIVSIGYGDGYPRVIDDTAWVSLQLAETHYKCAVIGRVSMDMIAVDVTALADQLNIDLLNSGISTPIPVTLWGDTRQGAPSVDEVAKAANTIGYELLCRVTERPIRRVI